MSDRVLSLLKQLSTAVSDGAFDEAQEIGAELQTEYANQREGEVNRTTRASTLLASSEAQSVEDATALTDVIRVDGSTRMTRSILLLMVSSLAESHEVLRENGQLEETVATIEAAIEELMIAEREAETASTDADEVISTSTVPPSLVIRDTSVEYEGNSRETASVSVTVANTGDRTATGVTLSFQPPDSVATAEDQLRLGDLDSDQSRTVDTNATLRAGGVHAIGVRATGGNANSAYRTVTLVVSESGDSNNPFDPPGSDSQTPDGPPGPPDSDGQTPDNSIGTPGLDSQTPDQKTTTTSLRPTPSPSGQAPATETETETADSAGPTPARGESSGDTEASAGEDGSGFGILSALTGIGYLLHRGLSGNSDSDE